MMSKTMPRFHDPGTARLTIDRQLIIGVKFNLLAVIPPLFLYLLIIYLPLSRTNMVTMTYHGYN